MTTGLFILFYFQISPIHDREGKFGRSYLKKGEVQIDETTWPQSADDAGAGLSTV